MMVWDVGGERVKVLRVGGQSEGVGSGRIE